MAPESNAEKWKRRASKTLTVIVTGAAILLAGAILLVAFALGACFLMARR